MFKSLKDYLEFLKNPDNYREPSPLSVGATDSLVPAEYADLFEYIPQYKELVEIYDIPGITNRKSVFRKALSIMNWLTQNTFYSGMQKKILKDDTLDILSFSVGKGFEYAINCRYKAIAFTDLLITHGSKAYPILLEDAEHYGCHFIVHVFVSEENRWAAFDPSFNCYFADESNSVLNVYELCELILDGKEPTIVGYCLNGTTECIDIYRKYFIGSTLTNISTWNDNSNDKRDSANSETRKSFNSRLPDMDAVSA